MLEGVTMSYNINDVYVTELDDGYILYNLETLKVLRVDKDGLLYIRKVLKGKIVDSAIDDFFTTKKTGEKNKNEYHLVLFTGYQCNYSCSYCYEHKYRQDKRTLTENMLDQIELFYLEYRKKLGIKGEIGTVSFIGGEPLLEQNRKLIESAVNKWKDKNFIISTNGVNISEFTHQFKDLDVAFNVSVDGIKEIHYLNRHTCDQAAYDKTINGIKMALNQGNKVNIMTVFSDESIDKYPLFLDELEKMGWPQNGLRVNIIPEINECGFVEHRKMETSLNRIKDVLKKESRFKYVNLLKFAPGLECFLEENAKTYYCSRLEGKTLVFKPDGKVYLCQICNCTEIIVGEFYPEIRIYTDRINDYLNRKIENMRNCRDCKYKYVCRGGCVAASLNSGNGILDGFCHYWENDEWKLGFDVIGANIFGKV